MRTRTAHPALRAAATAAVVSLGVAACANDARPGASGQPTIVGVRGDAPVTLAAGRGCDAVLEDFQAFAPDVFAERRTGSVVGDTGAVGLDMAVEESVALDATDGAATAPSSQAAATGGARAVGATSDTNTQEEGIDEPDVVETDGEFVYLVDRDTLVVLDGATAEVRSRTQLATHGARLLLHDDRLLAISGGGYGVAPAADVVDPVPSDGGAATRVEPSRPVQSPDPDDPDEPRPDVAEPEPLEPEPVPEPVPEPSLEPPRFSAGTVIQLIDVADRTAPEIIETTEVEGSHLSTRVVDGVARVVVSTHPRPHRLFDRPTGGSVDDVGAALEARVADTAIDDWLPAFRTTTTGTATVEGTMVDCDGVFMPEVNAGLTETSVLRVGFDDGFDPGDTTTVVAEAGTVYASASTLYLAANRHVHPGQRDEVDGDAWSTALHAFDLGGDGAATHTAAGEIPGHVLNQYSLSEHDGHLRVATTEGAPWDAAEPSESGVRVLRPQGGELVEVGAVTGLGVTETIQSVRFMGPVGYVVTFRQTDPLYVIDLGDPTAPETLGELKIPGFSSYLHPVGEGRLVGIGRDADLEGRDRGFLLSLFDVSDPRDPEQLQTHTERGAHSLAGSDPKAFLWWAPESAVAIPIDRHGVATTRVGPDGAPGDEPVRQGESGVAVFDVADDGITERGTVTHDGRRAFRALVVQDRLWSVFDGGVAVSDFGDVESATFHPFR